MHPARNDALVSGSIGYFQASTGKPYNYMYEPPAGIAPTNCEYDLREVPVRNGRTCADALSLRRNGFELLDTPTSVSDFYDKVEVVGKYYREIEELAVQLTCGTRAVVFDRLLRQREEGRQPLTFGRAGDGLRPSAVGRVHNDYSEASGMRRLHLVVPDAPPESAFLILNFWRPVLHPAIDAPLALCDARSFPMEDWIATDIHYADRSGEIYLGRYSADHQWYYFPEMSPSEMVAFVSFDSRVDSIARMTPHCAFDDPTASPDAPPRRSMEVRCLVLLA